MAAREHIRATGATGVGKVHWVVATGSAAPLAGKTFSYTLKSTGAGQWEADATPEYGSPGVRPLSSGLLPGMMRLLVSSRAQEKVWRGRPRHADGLIGGESNSDPNPVNQITA